MHFSILDGAKPLSKHLRASDGAIGARAVRRAAQK
jgi:hypothetical protein